MAIGSERRMQRGGKEGMLYFLSLFFGERETVRMCTNTNVRNS